MYNFFNVLRTEGSLYFYPSKIDYEQKNILIHGIMYILHENNFNYYHFCELKIIFLNKADPEMLELELELFPFVKNLDVRTKEKL